MNNKEIHELIKLLDKSEVAEFKLKQGDFAITIRSKDFFKGKGQQVVSLMPNNSVSQPIVSPAPAAPSLNTATEEKASEVAENAVNAKHIEFKSPMVGTFYRKPSPDKDVFVKVGDKINKGDVVAIIEAMKLFNEIESEVSGTIVKILIDDQTPVEFDQTLFIIDPS